MLDRTEGVTASFLKELLRRAAAVLAADRLPAGEEEVPDAVRVSADDLVTALDDLLDTRNRMTRRARSDSTLGIYGAPRMARSRPPTNPLLANRGRFVRVWRPPAARVAA